MHFTSIKQIKKNVEKKQDWENVLAKGKITRKLYTYKFDTEKQTIILMGDEHLGSKFYDSDSHLRDVEYCYENKIPIILMGDEMETATKDSVGSSVFDQEEIVQEQLEKIVEIYKPLANEGLILGNHIGNHETRVYNQSGANLSKILATMLKINYLDVGAVHYFKVGKFNYSLYTTHGTSGAILPHTKIANTIKMSNMVDVDIYAQGHLHQLSHHVQNYYVINKRKRIIEEHQKHYILTGCYLTHWGSYAHIRHYEPARKGCAKIKLHGLEDMIRISL